MPDIVYHTVKYGETLRGIAEKYYDDPEKSVIIFQHNRHYIQNPNVVYPGQKIMIPKIDLDAKVLR